MNLKRIVKKLSLKCSVILLGVFLAGCRGDWSGGFKVVREIDVGSRAVDIFYQRGRLYAVGEENEAIKLQVLDVTKPTEPRKLCEAALGKGRLIPTKFIEGSIYVRDDIAGVACSEPGRLVVVDVSKPDKLRVLNELAVSGEASDVWITPEKLAVVTSWSGVCYVFDLSEPSAVKAVAEILPPVGSDWGDGSTGPEKYASSVWVEGNIAYIIWWVHSRLISFDISQPDKPKRLGELQTTQYVPRGGWAYRILVSGGRAYVSSDQYSKKVGGVHILDVSDAANMKHLGFFTAKGYGSPEPKPRKFTRNLALLGKYLFVSDHNFGIVCLDVSSPKQIVLRNYLKTDNRQNRRYQNKAQASLTRPR